MSFEKDYVPHATRNTKTLMSCTKISFCHKPTEAYKKVLVLLFNRCLHPFYLNASPREDMSVTEELMESVRHTMEVNKYTVVDMETFQFNYKLVHIATQKTNLPLPPCKYINSSVTDISSLGLAFK